MAALLFGLFWGFPSLAEPSVLVKRATNFSFFREQMRYPRFRAALAEKNETVVDLLREKGLPLQPKGLFIRVLKRPKQLELWMVDPRAGHYRLVKTYRVCALSGEPGPKRKQGDRQIPEGFYHVDRFNPASAFHLSLGLNYPNAADRILGDPVDPGDDIFIHGDCVTIGCVPITDHWVKELYLLCVAAKANGQKRIPVHIFPTFMVPEHLDPLMQSYPQHKAFWENLAPVYRAFQDTQKLRPFGIRDDGVYFLVEDQ